MIILKKLVSLVISIILLLNVLAVIPTTVSAATLSVYELMAKFPEGKYWNKKNGKSNPDGWTDTPCENHKVSTASCQGQCYGFAHKLARDAYGSNPEKWKVHYSVDKIKAGDVVRIGNKPGGRHSIFVLGVNENDIIYADCNWDYHCGIRWNAKISKDELRSGNNALTNVKSSPGDLRIFNGSQGATNIDTTKDVVFYYNEGSSDYWWDTQLKGPMINSNGNLNIISETPKGVSQVFRFTRQADGSYVIQSMVDKKALTASGNSVGSAIILSDYNGSASQKWFVFEDSAGQWAIKSSTSDLVIDLNYNKTNQIKLNKYSYSSSQMLWTETYWYNLPSINCATDRDGTAKFSKNSWFESDLDCKMQIKKVGGEVVYTGELPSSEGVTLTFDPGKYEVKSVFKTIFGDEYSSDATNFTILDYTYDFNDDYSGYVILSYRAKGKNVTIPSKIGEYSVLEIAEKAFYGNTTITSATVPSSVKTIGKEAFADCTSLTNVTLEQGVTTLSDYAFANCESLQSVRLPDSIAEIGKEVFTPNENLTVYCSFKSLSDVYATARGITVDVSGKVLASGDYNFDSKTTVADARGMVVAIAKQADFTAEQIKVADMNFDGKITVADVRMIVKQLAS